MIRSYYVFSKIFFLFEAWLNWNEMRTLAGASLHRQIVTDQTPHNKNSTTSMNPKPKHTDTTVCEDTRWGEWRSERARLNRVKPYATLSSHMLFSWASMLFCSGECLLCCFLLLLLLFGLIGIVWWSGAFFVYYQCNSVSFH